MKKKIVIIFMVLLFIVGMLFYAGVVHAQTETPTPEVTPTFTVTPISQVKDCPEGDPLGWGTYTPSPLWSVECNTCFDTPAPTETMYPTMDATAQPTEFSGTATAQFLTGTPTPTITPTPQLYGLVCGIGSNIDCEQIGFDHIKFSTSGSEILGSPFGYFSYDGEFPVDVVVSVENGTDGLFTSYDPGNGTSPQATGDYEYPSYINQNGVTVVSAGTYSYEFTEYWADYYKGYIGYGWSSGALGAGFTYRSQGVYIDIYGSFYNPIATPTPSPNLFTDYCSSVIPSEEEVFGFELFSPDGAPNCDMGWSEFEVGTYTVPEVEICFQPSQIGVITMFGEDYQVGIFALAAAAAFLWRFMRTV